MPADWEAQTMKRFGVTPETRTSRLSRRTLTFKSEAYSVAIHQRSSGFVPPTAQRRKSRTSCARPSRSSRASSTKTKSRACFSHLSRSSSRRFRRRFGLQENGPTFSYYRARYYDPISGRFLSEDPGRFPGGIDFYTYVENGQLLDTTNHNNYLQNEYNQQVANQCQRISQNLPQGGSLANGCNNPNIIGGHANFAFSCSDPSCGPGRYGNGVHVECASGSSCNYNDPLVIHNDTVSPWTGPFTFSDIFAGAFWEHGFVDLIYGSACDCVFPY